MGLHINNQNKPGIKNNNKKSFLFCGGSHHKIDSCIRFLQLTLKQRFDYLKVNKICGKCLKSSHNFDTCDSTCKLCQGGHHYLLCVTDLACTSGENHIKNAITFT